MATITYDKLERAWRLENDKNEIAGYFATEAAARAALQPAEQGDDAAFVALLRRIDTLAEQHQAAPIEAPRLSDGTPVEPAYDTDGSFSGYDLNTATFGISTDDSGHVAFEVFDPSVADNDPYHSDGFDLSPALWRNLKALVASGIIDELMEMATNKPLPPIAPRRR